MPTHKIAGKFTQTVFSPRGGVEGFLLESNGHALQLVLDKDDEKGAALVATLEVGQQVIATAEDLPPSKKGPGDHPVSAFRKFVSIDGAAPRKVAPEAAGYTGKVVRLNYARHGAPNGYVLDSGHFIHVRPDGFARLKLKVGDHVSADGDAHFLSTGGGWAVEATSVNRRTMK